MKSIEISLNDKKLYVYPIFEPICDIENNILAFEMLCRITNKENEYISPKYLFENAIVEEMFEIFIWQLSFLKAHEVFFHDKKVMVSVNINKNQAQSCIEDVKVLEKIKSLSHFLRLEVNENFWSTGKDESNNFILEKINNVCPLWLDDFGCGSANLLIMMSSRFEVIKIDRVVVNELSGTLAGKILLSSIIEFSKKKGVKTILEGIESLDALRNVDSSQAWAFQGWLWPVVNQHEIAFNV